MARSGTPVLALLLLAGAYFYTKQASAAASPAPAAPPASSGGNAWNDFSNWIGATFSSAGTPSSSAPSSSTPAGSTIVGAPGTNTETATSSASWISDLFGLGFSPTITSPTQLNMNAYWKTGSYPQYAVAIANAEDANGIPRDLYARLLYQESHYRPDIIDCQTISSAGARGIAQFEPATAAGLGVDPCNPDQAIPGGAQYLAQLYANFGNWSYALMAYNWGEGNVRAWLASGKTNPVPTQTSNYVADITADVPIA